MDHKQILHPWLAGMNWRATGKNEDGIHQKAAPVTQGKHAKGTLSLEQSLISDSYTFFLIFTVTQEFFMHLV